jgi:CO/xanthine dehydrogenase FAD-binding subunit
MTATTLFTPRSVNEAVDLMRRHGADLVVLAGGTIVMQMINDGALFPRQVMSLRRASLDGLHLANGHVEIGATARLARVAEVGVLPPLAEAARAIGGPALRSMATVGGNLFAHPPHGDLGAPLLALGAEVELAGGRVLAIEDFYAERTSHATGKAELVTAIRVSRPQGRTVYLKCGRRQGNTPSVVAVAVQVVSGPDGVCRDARIALQCAGTHPLRARGAEAQLRGCLPNPEICAAVAEAAMAEAEPFSDALASEWYRRRMIGVYVQRALEATLLMRSAQ